MATRPEPALCPRPGPSSRLRQARSGLVTSPGQAKPGLVTSHGQARSGQVVGMSSFRRRLGRTAEDAEDSAKGVGSGNGGSVNGSGRSPYTASKKARKQRHHKQSRTKGSTRKDHARGSSALSSSMPCSSSSSSSSNNSHHHHHAQSGRTRSASDHATPKISATRSPRAAAAARSKRSRQQPSFSSQRAGAPPASPSRSAATVISSNSADSFSSMSSSASTASTSLPATGLLLMGKAQEARVQQQQNTLSSQLFEKLSKRMGGLIGPTAAAAAAARSKETNQGRMKEQGMLAKFEPKGGSGNGQDAGSPGIERRSSSSLSHEELAERLSHQLHYRATVAKAKNKEQETKTDRSGLGARSGASTAPSTPKGRFRGRGISSSPVRNARTRSPPSPSSRTTSLEVRERQLRDELERRGQDLLRRHEARKAAGKPTNIIPYIPPAPEQKGHYNSQQRPKPDVHQPPGSPHRYRNLKLPADPQHSGNFSSAGRGSSPSNTLSSHHRQVGSASNGGLQALTSPSHKGGTTPGLGSLSDLGILGTRKQIAPPPKSKRRIAHAGWENRAGAGAGTEDGTVNGARDSGSGSIVGADGSEGTAQSYERPRHRRLRLREKIVAVLDRINDANVPIVAAGACRSVLTAFLHAVGLFVTSIAPFKRPSACARLALCAGIE